MRGFASMAVALLCYAAFFVAFVYLVGFLAGHPLMPTHVDKGIAASVGQAVAVDLGLIALFGLQHSVMARAGFKAAWTKVVPRPIERSVYCLFTAMALGLLYAFWHPIPAVVWHLANPVGREIVWVLFGLGFLTVFVSTWLISHFDLFGVAQAWRFARGLPEPGKRFRTPGFYRFVRHPIYLGFFIALWAVPTMSVGHLLLSAGLSLYLLIGIHYEERDLVADFGPVYEEYRVSVGMFVPRRGGR